MGKMIRTQLLFLLIISLAWLLPLSNITANYQLNQYIAQIETGNIYEVTDFSGFQLTHDDENIHSYNNIDNVTFSYYGDSPDEPLYDRFQYNLPTNCADFFISVKLEYFANETSAIFISYLFVVGEDHALTAPEVWDAWTAKQAKYYIKGYPNGIADDKESSDNIAGLIGTVIFQIKRVENILTTTILSEEHTVLLTKTWTEGVSTRVSFLSVNHRSGWLGAETHATFYDLYANFTKPDTGGITLFLGHTSGLPILTTVVLLGIINIYRIWKKKK